MLLPIVGGPIVTVVPSGPTSVTEPSGFGIATTPGTGAGTGPGGMPSSAAVDEGSKAQRIPKTAERPNPTPAATCAKLAAAVSPRRDAVKPAAPPVNPVVTLPTPATLDGEMAITLPKPPVDVWVPVPAEGGPTVTVLPPGSVRVTEPSEL